MLRIDEALDLCFSDNDSSLSSKAFVLFSKLDSKSIDQKIFNNALLSKATNVFIIKNVNPVIISRLSSILLYSIRNFPNDCLETCGVVIQLLQYVHITGVSEMFATICEFNSPLVEVQTFLEEAGFSRCVMNTLKLTSDKEVIAQIIRIVRMSSGNPVLMKSFKQPFIVEEMTKFLDYDDHFVISNLWRCLTGLICENTYHAESSVLEKAISIVKESFDDVQMYRVFAMDFIGKYIQYDKSVAKYYNDNQVLETAAELLVRFNNCTNLVTSIFRLFNNSFNIPAIIEWTIRSLIPILMGISIVEERNSAKAAALNFLTDLSTKSQTDKALAYALNNVPGYKDFCTTVLYPYNEVLFAKYGGRMEHRITRKPSTVLFGD